MMIPLCALYLISILFAVAAGRNRKKSQQADGAGAG